MYLRACSDGSVNQYYDLYLYCHMLSLTHASECHRRMPNEQVNDHFYGIILHYYMYGGGILYVLMVGVGLHKIHSQPGAPCRLNPPLLCSSYLGN